MKLSLVFFLLLNGIFFAPQLISNPSQVKPTTHVHQNETVYICDSEGATKYHSKNNCRGLNNCKADIVPISKKEAIQLGREECGWCY